MNHPHPEVSQGHWKGPSKWKQWILWTPHFAWNVSWGRIPKNRIRHETNPVMFMKATCPGETSHERCIRVFATAILTFGIDTSSSRTDKIPPGDREFFLQSLGSKNTRNNKRMMERWTDLKQYFESMFESLNVKNKQNRINWLNSKTACQKETCKHIKKIEDTKQLMLNRLRSAESAHHRFQNLVTSKHRRKARYLAEIHQNVKAWRM